MTASKQKLKVTPAKLAANKINALKFQEAKKKEAESRIGTYINVFKILAIAGVKKKSGFIYTYLCPYCGKQRNALKGTLESNSSGSCGCHIPKQSQALSDKAASNLGKTFGYLTILNFTPVSRRRGMLTRYANCVCACGNKKIAIYSHLMRGITTNCGCITKDAMSKRATLRLVCHRSNWAKKYNWSFKQIKMRSSYEVMFAEYLNRLNIPFEYEKYTFKLSNNTRYTPDFYVPSTDIFYELKGYMSPCAAKKIELLREAGKQVTVIYIKELEELCGITYLDFMSRWSTENNLNTPYNKSIKTVKGK